MNTLDACGPSDAAICHLHCLKTAISDRKLISTHPFVIKPLMVLRRVFIDLNGEAIPSPNSRLIIEVDETDCTRQNALSILILNLLGKIPEIPFDLS